MRDYQAVIRVRHQGRNLAESPDVLDEVTGALEEFGATALLWPDVTEWTMTVRVPTLWDAGPFAGRQVRDAYHYAGWKDTVIVRADAWQVAEWETARDLSDT
ncbi:hypothetical protein AB0K74_45265 [Streptomyces sp. NPDC056159]|uniref:hypothetical protein n=1 Tax=Streptomyces sp. NPDC056159 TaxID=3155537 RepID=UPI00342BD8FD